MIDTIQAQDEAVDSGLSELLNMPCVIKLTNKAGMGVKEVSVQKHFSKNPHRNVAQGICYFTCMDSMVRWESRLTAPQPICQTDGKQPFEMIAVVQEYIPGGNLYENKKTLTDVVWKSILYQLTYASIEWYSQGFVYGDWNSGNILFDKADDWETERTYNLFQQKTVVVKTEGICPVITDFGRTTLEEPSNLAFYSLTDSIGILWNCLANYSPVEPWKKTLFEYSVKVGAIKTPSGLLRLIASMKKMI